MTGAQAIKLNDDGESRFTQYTNLVIRLPKQQFLKNTVQDHPEFCNVKSTEDMITAIGVKYMTFQQYYDLLQSAAQPYHVKN